MLNVGILYAIQNFLIILNENKLTLDEVYQYYKYYDNIKICYIIDTALKCYWISAGLDNKINISKSGYSIINENDIRSKLSLQIKDVIKYEYPEIIALAAKGRNAIIHYCNPDTIQCFRDAGLVEGVDEKTVSWWDEFSSTLRLIDNLNKLKTSREGERLSYNFEEERIGKAPIWISLDNNTALYDILSNVSKTDPEKLLIEVKTSRKPFDQASFVISRYEWEFLIAKPNAVIHLWSLATPQPVQKIINIKDIEDHIPINRCNGKWEKTRIPFNIV